MTYDPQTEFAFQMKIGGLALLVAGFFAVLTLLTHVVGFGVVAGLAGLVALVYLVGGVIERLTNLSKS